MSLEFYCQTFTDGARDEICGSDVVEVFVAFDDDGVAAGVRRASVVRRPSHVDVDVGVGVASPDVAV